jgi:hypothetical protein
MRLSSAFAAAIFAPSKQTIMKGRYINTIIIMAARSGKQRRIAKNNKETLRTLSDHKITWSKSTAADTKTDLCQADMNNTGSFF